MTEKYINIHAEQIILGTCIMDNSQLEKIADILEEKHFSAKEHKEIWRRFVEIATQGVADKITLKDFFANNEIIAKVGGAEYLTSLLGQASLIVGIRNYALKLIELWQKRELQYLIEKASEELADKNFDAIVANLENEIAGLNFQKETSKTKRAYEIAQEMDAKAERGMKPKIIPTGLPSFDKILGGGLFSKRLYVVMATAGTGKTSLGLQLMINAEQEGKQSCFISLEMSAEEATNKIISHLRSVPLWKLQRGYSLLPIEHQAKMEALQIMKKYNLSINDSTNVSPAQIERIIKREMQTKPLQLVVVDYIQIMALEKDKNKNMADLIKQNSTALKNLAKKYDIAIVLLSQVKRNDNKRPTLEDLKGSGGIGEDADMVLALYCDNPKEKIKMVEFIINKNRWGRMTDFGVSFDGEFGRFNEIKI